MLRLSLVCYSNVLHVSSGYAEMAQLQSSKAMWRPTRSVEPFKSRTMLMCSVIFTELDCKQYQGQAMTLWQYFYTHMYSDTSRTGIVPNYKKKTVRYEKKSVNHSNQSSSSSDNSIYAAFAAARRGAVMRGATGADSGSSNKISSSLLSVVFFAGAFFAGAFALPDAFRAVALGAPLDAAGFFSKKSVTEACVVDLVFFAGLTYASLSSSSLSGLSEVGGNRQR
jgi:hypothetical protein